MKDKYDDWMKIHNELETTEVNNKAITLLQCYTGQSYIFGSYKLGAFFNRLGTNRHHVIAVTAAISQFEEELAKAKESPAYLYDRESVIKKNRFGEILSEKINWDQVNKEGDLWAIARILAHYCECVVHPDLDPNKPYTPAPSIPGYVHGDVVQQKKGWWPFGK